MANFKIPTATLDQEMGGGNNTFPAGLWQGVIERATVREITPGEGGDFFLQDKEKNYYADSCEVLSLMYGQNEGMEDGQPNVGEQKFFDDNFFLRIDDYVWDQDLSDIPDDFWRLRQTQLRLTHLARALDLVDEDDDGVAPVEDFDQLLRDTHDDPAMGLNGSEVVFKTIHRKFKKKNGDDGVEVKVVKYGV